MIVGYTTSKLKLSWNDRAHTAATFPCHILKRFCPVVNLWSEETLFTADILTCQGYRKSTWLHSILMGEFYGSGIVHSHSLTWLHRMEPLLTLLMTPVLFLLTNQRLHPMSRLHPLAVLRAVQTHIPSGPQGPSNSPSADWELGEKLY